MLTLGFSPCPNDTFIFEALVHGRLADCPGFGPEVLADVETLNAWALEGRLDVTKLSFHALGHVLQEYVLLDAGAALGRGCGPLLVAGREIEPAALVDQPIAIPGRYTTAAMLLGLFLPTARQLVVMPFERIMPAIVSGEVAAGVIIHESRFTYQGHGLKLIQDLGAWWEKVSGHPIPLGGIVARRSLGDELLRRIEQCIRQSVRWAFAHRKAGMDYIRQHAQELDEQVISSHIALYVTPFSESLGGEGLAAVTDFLARGRAAGILPAAPAASLTL